jgi:hypothetical protein
MTIKEEEEEEEEHTKKAIKIKQYNIFTSIIFQNSEICLLVQKKQQHTYTPKNTQSCASHRFCES